MPDVKRQVKLQTSIESSQLSRVESTRVESSKVLVKLLSTQYNRTGQDRTTTCPRRVWPTHRIIATQQPKPTASIHSFGKPNRLFALIRKGGETDRQTGNTVLQQQLFQLVCLCVVLPAVGISLPRPVPRELSMVDKIAWA